MYVRCYDSHSEEINESNRVSVSVDGIQKF
jgi:hypothetical protein